jgi:sugar/nucleoside kinase (ribokinase family)
MNMKYDVFLIGNASMDFIFTGLPRMPLLGEDTLAEGFDLIPGESFTNAVVLHRMGVTVAWAADFGNDPMSKLIVEEIRKEGLSEEFFVFHDRPFRRVSVAASFEKERAFLTHYDREPDIPAAIKALPVVKADILFVPGLVQGKQYNAALPLIKGKKMRIVMDGNCASDTSISSKNVLRSISSASVFIPNAKESRTLTGLDDLEMAAKKLSEFCPLVVIKDGCNGSIAYDRSTLFTSPGIPVKVVDTTGAGDCFSAGFIKAYLDGLSIQDCMTWGNIAGGLSTQGYGGTKIKVDVDKVNEYLQRHYSR